MSQALVAGEHMPIKKVINPDEFRKAWRDLEILFQEENQKYGHVLHRVSAESVINSWANPSLLTHTMHTWVNFEDEKANGIIMFFDTINTICGKRVWNEYFWISKNPQASFSLLRKALQFARSKGVELVSLSCVENHPKSPRLKELYKKLGFQKDCETYIKKL